jgi:hypothetical protein
MHDELLYLIALSNINGLGPVKAKSLLKHNRFSFDFEKY